MCVGTQADEKPAPSVRPGAGKWHHSGLGLKGKPHISKCVFQSGAVIGDCVELNVPSHPLLGQAASSPG